jgi:ribosome-binding factor A
MPRNSQRAPSQRQLRVGEELRHLIAHILEKGDIRDPDVAGKLITVTEVSVSPDLRSAVAYVVPLGGGEDKALLAGLKRVAPFFRHELARRLALRAVPSLTFAADIAFERARRIEALLAQPEVRRDLAGPSPQDEPDGT